MTSVKPLPPPGHPPQPLPTETVRDLLGIARAMYAAQRQRGNHAVARRIRGAGEKLRHALVLAMRDGDAAAHERAWDLADDALSIIAFEQQMAPEDLGRAIAVTAQRMHLRRHGPDNRDAKRADRIKRG